MGNYPIVKQDMKCGMKVGISSVYVCGNLHRAFEVIYSVPGDWTETALKWCGSVAEAFVEVLLNEYALVEGDFFDWSWIKAEAHPGLSAKIHRINTDKKNGKRIHKGNHVDTRRSAGSLFVARTGWLTFSLSLS